MNAPDWKEVLPVPPPRGHLHEAWMTSFEQPDAGLLVEHFLPSLLGANHSLSQEMQERTLFFGELDTALEALRGRLTVISSPPRGERQPSQYPWLWRYLGHFTVGAESRAVQHAKLWAFHWKVDEQEFLELHVSSTNLTGAAFKGQVQAGWQATLQLEPSSNAEVQSSWRAFVPFLDALGKSAGLRAAKRLERLKTLLGRVLCPADVTFIASIPGDKSAAHQLKNFDPTEIHVMTPTIGEWEERTLAAWGKDVGIDRDKIHLKWISESHPWASSQGWSLSTPTANILTSKIQLECLPEYVRFVNEHRDGDERWSHAKLYLIRTKRKKKRHLLITSANWSPSAWGHGNTGPRNFELGVVIETDWTDLEKMADQFTNCNTCFSSHLVRHEIEDTPLQWAEVTWDGSYIELQARSSNTSTPILVTIIFSSGPDEQPLKLFSGNTHTMKWTDAERTPLTARFTQGDDILEVDVLDLRPPEEFAKTPLPEVDTALAAALREAFLLQRYGGPVVDEPPGKKNIISRAGGATPSTDYGVQAWLDARAAFHVVDRWQAALDEVRKDSTQLDRICLDGFELHALYARRNDPASQLAAEELVWRLQEVRNE